MSKVSCPFCDTKVAWNNYGKHVLSAAHLPEVRSLILKEKQLLNNTNLPHFDVNDKVISVCFGCKKAYNSLQSNHVCNCSEQHSKAIESLLEEKKLNPIHEQSEKTLEEWKEEALFLRKKVKELEKAISAGNKANTVSEAKENKYIALYANMTEEEFDDAEPERDASKEQKDAYEAELQKRAEAEEEEMRRNPRQKVSQEELAERIREAEAQKAAYAAIMAAEEAAELAYRRSIGQLPPEEPVAAPAAPSPVAAPLTPPSGGAKRVMKKVAKHVPTTIVEALPPVAAPRVISFAGMTNEAFNNVDLSALSEEEYDAWLMESEKRYGHDEVMQAAAPAPSYYDASQYDDEQEEEEEYVPPASIPLKKPMKRVLSTLTARGAL